MENQINLGDQNTQQVGQKLTSQPVQIPEKPKVIYWMIPTAVLLLLFLGISGLYFLNIRDQKVGFQEKTYIPTTSPHQQEATVAPTKSPVLPTAQETMVDKNYCTTMLLRTSDIRNQQKPDDYINQSQNKKYLEIWKELFIKNNQFTEDYFNQHIRISSDSIFKPNTGIPPEPDKYFEVQYYFITNWLFFLNRDGFVIKYPDTDKYLTKEEIIGMAGDFSKPIVEKAWQINISYIRNKNGELIEEIKPCEEIVNKLKNLNPVLTHYEPYLRPFAEGLIIRSLGEAGSNKCPRATISLTKAEVIYYSPDNPCVVY